MGLAALAFLTFANSLWNGFAYDDLSIIAENPAIRRPSNLRGIFAAGYWPEEKDLLYRPLIILSYALNYALAGLAPFPYHLVNVLLHAGNCALVYHLVLALFRRRGLALATAAAFALHPIHTEAVANVVGRAELLANAGLFLSWLAYLRGDEAPVLLKRRWLVASVAAFALAIFTKEHAVVLLGLLVLTDLLRASQRGRPLGQTLWERAQRVYAWYLLPFVGYLLARFLVIGAVVNTEVGFPANPLAHTDPWTRVLTAIKVLGRYFWLLLVPVRLSADYSYNQIPISRSLLEPGVLAGLLGLALALALAVWTWRRAPALSAGVAVFVLTILPVSNLPFPIGTIMAERVLYLPSLGFCLLLGWAVMALAGRPRWGLVALSAFAPLLLGYGTRTVLRNRDWRSTATLFAATVRSSPGSAPAHYQRGTDLLKRGDFSSAQRELERSLEIFPKYADAYTNLGLVFEEQGRIEDAIRAFKTASNVDRNDSAGHLYLGLMYIKKGEASAALGEFRSAARNGGLKPREVNLLAKGFVMVSAIAEAQESLEAAVHYSPDSFSLRNNLGLVYLSQGRMDDAQRTLEAAAALKRESPEVHMNLGRVYAARGMAAQAEAAFRRSLELQPGNLDALSFLGDLLAREGRLPEAEEKLHIAVRQHPDHPETHYTLGIILARQEKLVEAQREFEAALRLRPQYPLVRRALGMVLQQQGRVGQARREFKLADDQEKLVREGAPPGWGR